jgi:hypothetical protein
MRRSEWSNSFSSIASEIGAADAREQHSELGLGAQKKTRGQPAKDLHVIRRSDLCVIFEDWDW